jgi:hypothetical protein
MPLYADRASPPERAMTPEAVFVTLLACAYLGIGILGLRTVLRETHRRPVRERRIGHFVENRYRPGGWDL